MRAIPNTHHLSTSLVILIPLSLSWHTSAHRGGLPDVLRRWHNWGFWSLDYRALWCGYCTYTYTLTVSHGDAKRWPMDHSWAWDLPPQPSAWQLPSSSWSSGSFTSSISTSFFLSLSVGLTSSRCSFFLSSGLSLTLSPGQSSPLLGSSTLRLIGSVGSFYRNTLDWKNYFPQ